MNDIPTLAKQFVLPQYRLDPTSNTHGEPHWKRVAANGAALCDAMGIRKHDTIRKIVEWFAYLHDACRHDDDADPNHGVRAAVLVRHAAECGLLRGLHPLDVDTLQRAVSWHSAGRTFDNNIAVQICWDADRLDLPRVGTRPDPLRMCTSAGMRFAEQASASMAAARAVMSRRQRPMSSPAPGARRVPSSYATAIEWIVLNDSTDWTQYQQGIPSTAARLVADLYSRSVEQVTKDIRKRLEAPHEALSNFSHPSV